jgi:hypothetical protein
MIDNFSNSQHIRKHVVATEAGVVASQHRRAAEVGAAVAVSNPSPVDIHHARSNHAATASFLVQALARVAGEPACYPHVRAVLQSHPECVRVLQQLATDLK